MTLQQLKYIITIAETGSLNRAAEQLFVSQPSLSNSVKELERELGITILHRSGRGVTLTGDGAEFLLSAREIYRQYELLREKYASPNLVKKKFGVSAQHYSFAVKAFVELVKAHDTKKYEFAMRETGTRDVIDDVSTTRSELGILYITDFNRPVLSKLFRANDLEFCKLVDCKSHVYLWEGHPLAKQKQIAFSELAEFPCLSFEQGERDSFYLSEGILSTNEYPRSIKVSDRATVLNLMVGLNGYIICPAIICEELSGEGYASIPLREDADNRNPTLEIGYIKKKNTLLSRMAQLYIEELKRYLSGAVSK